MEKFLSVVLSYRTWLILTMLTVSNLFFEGGYYNITFNVFELLIAIISVSGLIGTIFFGKKLEKLFTKK